MDFFEESDVIDLAHAHIEKVQSLEDNEAERILKLYRNARTKLRDRLDALPAGTFSAQQVRSTLVQVDAAIAQMTGILGDEMGSASEVLAKAGVTHLVEEFKKWNKVFKGAAVPIDLDAVKIASDTSNFLFNKYEASLRSYGEGLRATFASEITEGAIAEDSTSSIVHRLGQLFLGEEWKLHRIVRTELHNVYNIGKINGMKELVDTSVPDLKKTLFHPMDSRTGKDSIRLAQNNPIVDVDEPFVENSTGKKLVYMAPPNRPNDRAILIPYRESWG
jgi:hypothetical protein